MAAQTVVPLQNPKPPPLPPQMLADDIEGLDYWYEAWSEGVSTLWTEADGHSLARAARMHGVVSRTGASAEVLSKLNIQISKVEDALFLSPASRRRHNIVVEAEEQAAAERGDRREALSERLRAVG